jgi:hypothetical protein
MAEGWKCPNCGKAHGPHVDTCPEPGGLALPFSPSPFPYPWPGTLYDPPPMWPPYTTCGDPPGSVGSGSTRVIDPVSGRDLGPSD